jgi:hypothetical protein
MLQYHGIDWLIFALLTLHIWLLGMKVRFSFIIGAVGCCCGVVLAVMIDSVPALLMNCLFAYLNLRNYRLWGKSEAPTKPS